MKKLVALVLSALMVFGMAACLAETNEAIAKSPEELARGFVDALGNCSLVEEKDNKIGFGIGKIEKVGDNFIVYWTSTNELLTVPPFSINNQINQMKISIRITFFDPQDYTHHYAKTAADFPTEVKGNEAFDNISINLPTSSNVVYVYFNGIEDPSEMYTVPLFYTLILDDNPRLLEDQPRAANGIFDKAIAE